MQFFSTIILAATALASTAIANTVHFVNQDSTTRTIYFTGNPGMAVYPKLVVPGLGTANQDFATGWTGNWYSVSEGAPNVPGMLGEVAWDAYAGAHYFDVSAIVNPNDNEGVKQLFPKNSNTPISGCQNFPCANRYNKPDDVATLSTTDSELVCLLGNQSNQRRRGLVARIRDLVES